MSNTFGKHERLCSTTLLEQLYSRGARLLVFPYSIRLLETRRPLPSPVQVVIATSKRHFKHAVDRNRVKRMTRECYRTRKEHLYCLLDDKGIQIALSLQYIGDIILPYGNLNRKMDKVISAILERIEQGNIPVEVLHSSSEKATESSHTDPTTDKANSNDSQASTPCK